MKRELGMVVAFGVASVGSILLAAPTVAGEAELQMQLDRYDVVQGEQFTLSSVDPCAFDKAPGVLVYVVVENWNGRFVGDFEVVPDPSGSWSLPLAFPTSVPPGKYTLDAACYDIDPDDPDATRPPRDFWYEPESFSLAAKPVVTAPSTTGPDAPALVSTPAPAVPGRPAFTG